DGIRGFHVTGVQTCALPIFDGLSFDLEKGTTLGIVGESGSGKSVTSLSILGLHDPSTTTITGEIWLEDQELVSADRAVMERLREIGRASCRGRGEGGGVAGG